MSPTVGEHGKPPAIGPVTRRALFSPRTLIAESYLLELSVERCTLCGACAIACPTDALRYEEDLEAGVLRFDPRACTGCDRCVETCPESAIAVERGVEPPAPHAGQRELVSAPRQRCTVCGTNLPPRPMRRRLRELLPAIAHVPLELCTGCAVKTARRSDVS